MSIKTELSSSDMLWSSEPCQFVYQYDKLSEVAVVLDARTAGNTARYIRRSCVPNAEARQLVHDIMTIVLRFIWYRKLLELESNLVR